MPSEGDCKQSMLVLVRWKSHQFGIPLSQLEGIQVDKYT